MQGNKSRINIRNSLGGMTLLILTTTAFSYILLLGR